jgi:hypothetical protein
MSRSRAPREGTNPPLSSGIRTAEPTVAEVCEKYAAAAVKVAIDDIDGALVLLRGSQQALLFLSELIRAHALSGDTGFHLSPKGLGAVLLAEHSKYGLYILRNDEREARRDSGPPPSSGARPSRR